MSTLTEKLISILERDRRPAVDPDAEKSDASILLPPIPDSLRYERGKVFYSSPEGGHVRAAIIVRTSMTECMLISLPRGNRWSDEHVFSVPAGFDGPTIEEFHQAFGDTWQVSRRGQEALQEWARTDV